MVHVLSLNVYHNNPPTGESTNESIERRDLHSSLYPIGGSWIRRSTNGAPGLETIWDVVATLDGG